MIRFKRRKTRYAKVNVHRNYFLLMRFSQNEQRINELGRLVKIMCFDRRRKK